MARSTTSSQQLVDHVERLRAEHPPIRWESVDFTVRNPDRLRTEFGSALDYLARVELEVQRNVKELDAIMPEPTPEDLAFYSDVWYHQEMQHGRILDRLAQEIGLPPAQPLREVGTPILALGVAAHVPAIQDVARTVYYFTGASTERQAVLAYSALIEQLDELGEDAVAQTIIHPIKRQEPGHFAFYQMSATKIVPLLKPWQKRLVQIMRSNTYELVGTHRDPRYQAQMGALSRRLGFDDPADYAREIGRLEARLLWDNAHGMEYPPYVLEAIQESARLARAQASEQERAA